jgi:hypothetical protein
VTPSEREALARLERLAAGLAPALAATFRRVLATIRNAATLDALAAAAEQGGADAVVNLLLSLDTETAATAVLARGLTPAVVATALTTARVSRPLTGLVAAVQRGFPEAEAAAQTMALDRYRTLATELRPVLRGVVADGIAAGQNPRVVAQAVRNVVGFTDYDRQIIASFRESLESGDFSAALRRTLRDRRSDAVLRRLAAASDGALQPAQVERMVAAYERTLLNWRAETWARTAALDATRTGQLTAWQAAIDRGAIEGPLVKRWVTRLDGREREGHRAANGQTVPWGQPFYDPSISAYVQIPGRGTYNCFPGDTPIEGAVRVALRSRYDGPMVRVRTRRGHVLTCTPNHPVLTTRGFVPARAIAQGDQVVSKSDLAERAAPSALPDDEQVPATVEQVFQSLAAQRVPLRERLSRDDLHGDAKRTDSYVEIVRADGRLLDDRETHSLERYGHRRGDWPFKRSQESAAALVGDRFSGEFDGGCRAAPSRGVRGRHLPTHRSGVGSEHRPLSALRIGPAAHWDIAFSEAAKQDVSRAPGLIGELLEAASGYVSLDEVVDVGQIESLHGWVYDVETESGVSVAAGIVVSNCRCAFTVRSAALADL